MVAVVRVADRIKARRASVCERTDLVRRTIECHVHIQSTIHRHCKHRIHHVIKPRRIRLVKIAPVGQNIISFSPHDFLDFITCFNLRLMLNSSKLSIL